MNKSMWTFLSTLAFFMVSAKPLTIKVTLNAIWHKIIFYNSGSQTWVLTTQTWGIKYGKIGKIQILI